MRQVYLVLVFPIRVLSIFLICLGLLLMFLMYLPLEGDQSIRRLDRWISLLSA